MKEMGVAGMFVSWHSGHRKGLVGPQPRCLRQRRWGEAGKNTDTRAVVTGGPGHRHGAVSE